MTATEPLLGSVLWDSWVKQQEENPSKRLPSGCNSVDVALVGGLGSGELNCISGEPNGGAFELAQAFLISHLKNSADTEAVVVDAGASFDVRRLHQALIQQYLEHGTAEAATTARKCLIRLKIMKIFDFVGLTESIGELRSGLEGRSPNASRTGSEMRPPRGTVPDSQDPDATLDDNVRTMESIVEHGHAKTAHPRKKTTLLVIDNIARVAVPLLKSSPAQGQALLISFMRSLALLTKRHNLYTIILNNASADRRVKDEYPSIFSSCELRPELDKAFQYTPDVSILVHRIPRSVADAKAVHGREHVRRHVETVVVAEVLQDRYSDRIARWAAYNVDPFGVIRGVE